MAGNLFGGRNRRVIVRHAAEFVDGFGRRGWCWWGVALLTRGAAGGMWVLRRTVLRGALSVAACFNLIAREKLIKSLAFGCRGMKGGKLTTTLGRANV